MKKTPARKKAHVRKKSSEAPSEVPVSLPLSYNERRSLYEDGYIVLRGAVPELMVRNARRAINASLGERGLHPDELPEMRSRTYCKELVEDPVIVDLARKTPVATMGEFLVGAGNLRPVTRAQIALRFPQIVARPREPGGHLDGIGTGINGVPVGTFIRSFTMLAVVLLQDVPEDYMGSFTVWPGSHRFFEDFFRDPKRDPSILAKGMPEDELPHGPIQIRGQAGDVVLSHHQLVHGAAPNYSPEIRYAAIFRLGHVDAQANGSSVMSDIWREWPGMRDVVGEAEPERA
ncbi:MAG: hypothetical protein EA425_05615 [Puniceicoccaceae bacterium]|nr:MAG: hypothetical protein EA425_05615 [Puniceicoccaceae bacterium]